MQETSAPQKDPAYEEEEEVPEEQKEPQKTPRSLQGRVFGLIQELRPSGGQQGPYTRTTCIQVGRETHIQLIIQLIQLIIL